MKATAPVATWLRCFGAGVGAGAGGGAGVGRGVGPVSGLHGLTYAT